MPPCSSKEVSAIPPRTVLISRALGGVPHCSRSPNGRLHLPRLPPATHHAAAAPPSPSLPCARFHYPLPTRATVYFGAMARPRAALRAPLQFGNSLGARFWDSLVRSRIAPDTSRKFEGRRLYQRPHRSASHSLLFVLARALSRPAPPWCALCRASTSTLCRARSTWRPNPSALAMLPPAAPSPCGPPTSTARHPPPSTLLCPYPPQSHSASGEQSSPAGVGAQRLASGTAGAQQQLKTECMHRPV